MALAAQVLLGAAAAVPAAPAVPTASGVQKSFEAFTDKLAADWMRANPAAATQQQYFAGAAQDALDRELTAIDAQNSVPLDPLQLAAFVARARAALRQLKTYRRSDLTAVQKVSAASLEWQLDDAVRMAEFSQQRFVFDQFRGLQVSLVNFLTQVHPIRNARDVDNYLARLRRVAPVIDEGVAVARTRAAAGTLPPNFIVQSTIEGIDRFLAAAPADNVLVTSLATRSLSTDLNPQARASAVTEARGIVEGDVRPAFGRVRALLAAELPLATPDAGLWRLQNGLQAYAAALHVNTTTNLSAEQIHALGLREVARIEALMDAQLRSLGFADGSVAERFQALEKSLQPPAAPDPRPLLLQRHLDILRDAEIRAADVFDLRPKAGGAGAARAGLHGEKRRRALLVARPRRVAAGHGVGSAAGSRVRPVGDENVDVSRGVPGHHFQIALQQESADLPLFRRKRVFGGLAAFAEGWALYAEQLAVESDWYRDDPQGRLGQLYDELFRARRLVVDSGLHALHWTRQQAIDYGISAAEVERYVVMPGQACAYKIGQLEILQLRSKAQDALGAKFSMKRFHDLLLRTGTVPLAVLETVVDADIAATSSH